MADKLTKSDKTILNLQGLIRTFTRLSVSATTPFING